MIDACPGCFGSGKGQAMEYARVKKQAADYVQEKQKSVALYREGLEIFFAETAFVYGIYPVIEVLQYDPSTATEQVY